MAAGIAILIPNVVITTVNVVVVTVVAGYVNVNIFVAIIMAVTIIIFADGVFVTVLIIFVIHGSAIFARVGTAGNVIAAVIIVFLKTLTDIVVSIVDVFNVNVSVVVVNGVNFTTLIGDTVVIVAVVIVITVVIHAFITDGTIFIFGGFAIIELTFGVIIVMFADCVIVTFGFVTAVDVLAAYVLDDVANSVADDSFIVTFLVAYIVAVDGV